MAQFFKPTSKKKITTKHQEYSVSKLDHQGDGIAFFDNKAVFIAGALPDERVLAQLTESKKHYARAKLIKVLNPSAQRVTPFCAHYNQCGGCNLQHLEHQTQIKQKELTLQELMSKFTAQAKIQLEPAIVGCPTKYRRRARFSLDINKEGKLNLGFRKRASKDIVNISDCPVLNQDLNTLVAKLHPLLDNLKGRRLLGHIELSTSHKGSVLFVRAIKALTQKDIESITLFAKQESITLFLKQGDEETQSLQGQAPYYLLENLKIYYQAQNFLQVNEEINKKMLSQAIDWLDIQKDEQVLDLFCGLGNFSLPLAKKAKFVVGIEGVEAMVEQAKNNAKLNSLNNIAFYHADLSSKIDEADWTQKSYQKILLDPARAGAFEIMDYLSRSKAKKILYVSCNSATLARDSKILLNNGYKLEKLGLLDMFPNTGHLESMALFVKA